MDTKRLIPLWIFIGMVIHYWFSPVQFVTDADQLPDPARVIKAMSGREATPKEVSYALKHNGAIAY